MSTHSYLRNLATNAVYGNNVFVISSKPHSQKHHKKEEVIRNLDAATYEFLKSGGTDPEFLTNELIFAKNSKFKFYSFYNFEKFELDSFKNFTHGEMRIDFLPDKVAIDIKVFLYSDNEILTVTSKYAELSSKIGPITIENKYKKLRETLYQIEAKYKEG